MFERGDSPIHREENSGINWPRPFDRTMIPGDSPGFAQDLETGQI